MIYRKFGSIEEPVSIIGLGAWAIGGGVWWGDNDDDDKSLYAIHAALDQGINLIDTAPVYGFGHSEEIVGKAIKGKRDKVILSTKCGLWWNDERGAFHFQMDGYRVNKCLDRETIRAEIEMSLKRLQTDYIDIYHTHWQAVEPYKTPIAETMAELLQLKKEGKIRSIAVSNADVSHMEEYLKCGRIDANQIKYNMLERKSEKDVVPYCIENNINILAYAPIEKGLLTGKINMDTIFKEGEFRNNIKWYKPENRKKVLKILEKWKKLTQKYDCTLTQLVLAWTFSQPGITHLLVGGRNVEHVLENARASELNLSSEDIIKMRDDIKM